MNCQITMENIDEAIKESCGSWEHYVEMNNFMVKQIKESLKLLRQIPTIDDDINAYIRRVY